MSLARVSWPRRERNSPAHRESENLISRRWARESDPIAHERSGCSLAVGLRIHDPIVSRHGEELLSWLAANNVRQPVLHITRPRIVMARQQQHF